MTRSFLLTFMMVTVTACSHSWDGISKTQRSETVVGTQTPSRAQPELTSDGWRIVAISPDSPHRSWVRGRYEDIDMNDDGKVDIRIESLGGSDNYLIKKDTNYDGYFDIEYRQGIGAEPLGAVRTIWEEVPSHH